MISTIYSNNPKLTINALKTKAIRRRDKEDLRIQLSREFSGGL